MDSTPEGEKKKGGGGGGSIDGGSGGEAKPKRKMKTAAQLELLEQTYLVETYPSEALRAELSEKLGLTDRQLQMWFCHRRLKDRKNVPVKRQKKDTPGSTVSVGGGGYNDDDMMGGSEMGNEDGSRSGSGSGSSPFEPRKVVARANAAVSRIGGDMSMVKRYYEPPQMSLESRAVAFVEAQLGEAIREDGPILGMDFDPLPPGAFGAPIAVTGQQKQAGRPFDGLVYERRDTKTIKASLMPNMELSYAPTLSGGKRKLTAGNVHVMHPQTSARAPQEYQFLPEQPSVRSEAYGRTDSSNYYNSAADAQSGRVSSMPTGSPYLHGKEQVTAVYGFQGQVSSGSVLSQHGRPAHVFSSASGDYDSPHRSPFANVGVDSQLAGHPSVGMESPYMSSDRQVEDDASRMERKRKSEEARIAREVEVHEKRIRKELEKQDILRRKREEQMRRDMERHDRERRKEEERLIRERLREEERFQREQRREVERREKFLQKENLRAEKMRQKEELRKEREVARLKAANERANARRIAKESMELIEDERLELMELAVSKKGLPSMLSLDSDTLQNLELFKDMLDSFPPKSVCLKRPLTVQPWSSSEESIGNLLMVWRFLITFSDVLELWPFTLDEFVQAMHDYEPRVLGEIHVALLRSIIKDIEDVARTPSIGLGANQNSAANPGGGHPQIVEGAYAWGFDIRCWQSHLNPMTWPEILRQFALSAGFGPQLKKRSLERTYYREDNEGHDGEDIVSTLRNGTAAENALAIMQEKGFSQPRKSRHRLTPGTVKFAAFHVLSLEGSKGLTILEVADRIQKSGLRDLTTSKTPEASIAAALSRDSNLFERTAPSTYCVRDAFRKDPADADAILSAAREKIQIFENGFSDVEDEKDVEDADDIERDEGFECDVAEDPEEIDVGISANSVQGVSQAKVSCAGNGEKDTLLHITPENGIVNAGKNFSSFLLEDSKKVKSEGATFVQSINDIAICNNSSNPEQEDTEIDESNSGEPWVQGLTEGEYSDLSVEERLNALVALVGVAIEGNSIRIILEERLEAANALKKQMWAEAQLDKRRLKEENFTRFQCPSYTGIKAEPSLTNSAVDGNQSPYFLDNKNNDAYLNPTVKQEPAVDLSNLPTERMLVGQDFAAGPDSLTLSHGFAAEKSRADLKSYIGHKAEEMYVYRSLPLGQDRRRNRYWQFVTSASRNDPGSARIFFESHDGCWRLIDTEEGFDALLASLDTRGMREAHLQSMLQRVEISFKEAVRRSLKSPSSMDLDIDNIKTEDSITTSTPDSNTGIESPSSTLCADSCDTQEQSSSFRIELGRTQTEKSSALKRYQDYERWMWKECFNASILCAMKFGKKRCTELLVTCDSCHDSYFMEDNHCTVCHLTFGAYSNTCYSDHMKLCEEKQKLDPRSASHGLNFSLPPRLRLLKLQLALVEVCLLPEALQSLWTEDYRKSWGMKLQASSSCEELLQLLTVLEGALKRDYLSSNFETTKELIGSSKTQRYVADGSYSALPGAVSVLPWVPQTSGAVALRLMELDTSISYMLQQKIESHKDSETGDYFKLPSRYTVVKNVQEIEQPEIPYRSDYPPEDNWISLGSGRSSTSGRGRGLRGRGRASSGGRRMQRGVSGLRSAFGRETGGSIEKSGQGLGRKSRTRGRGRRRGRRTARNRPRINGRFSSTKQIPVELPKSSTVMDWEREIRGVNVEEDVVGNIGEASDSDGHGHATGDDYDGRGNDYGGVLQRKAEDFMESDEDADELGDEDDEVDGDGEEEGYIDGDDDGDMELDEVQRGSEYGEGDEDDIDQNEDGDGTSSASSDYSD
ncbi:hypothetical protein IFM89_012468 [Coptis chinensis]|uniref:Homeobox-DDT domain protein RLT2 n=1 Tax=Coptis chinensis TaxID=261450 RepID=A0A835I4K2_9MAGN|nr:hypothetical protein IFM89_012468 [Coptis chinensis]